MKLKTLLPSILIGVLFFNMAGAQTKRGLIFAIGNYNRPDGRGWPQISSLNDVKYIKAALNRQGFSAANIKTVEDAQATVAGMTTALDDLIKSVKPNDVVIIHISSHGEQVQDDNDDESDGLDESIVGYDAVLPSRSADYKKDQSGYLRDDVFGAKINQLRAALGKNGDVIVFMDCCHSGSGSRGAAIGKPRGNQPPLVDPGFKRPARGAVKEEVFKEGAASRGDESSLATYVVISAAKAEQLNYETVGDDNVGMGSLTYAISKTFEKLDPAESYRSMFAKISVIMQDKVPAQQPVMEGNGIDRSLFGGRFVNQKPYVEIDYVTGTEVKLKSGTFAGLDSGAVIAVYKSGTTDTAGKKPLATGRVYKASNYAAFVKLDKDAGLQQAASGWVFVKTPVYKFDPVSIQVNPSASRGKVASQQFSAAEKDAIMAQFKQMPLVSFAGKPDLILVKGNGADSIFIAGNGYLYHAVPNAANGAEEIRKKIEAYVQYKFLQNIIVDDPDAKVQVKLVPYINGKADTVNADAKLVNGKYEYVAGDKMVLWVKNTGTQPVYFNILDMQPDGKINRVLPNKAKSIYPGDLKVAAGESRLYDKFPITLSPPYGTEIFKVFVSKTEIDMESIATTRGAGGKGNFTAFETLLKKSYDGSRGAESENLSATDGSSFNVLFEINKKQ